MSLLMDRVIAQKKLCTGPSHPDGPVELPLTEEFFYFRHTAGREGEAMSRCKDCVNWSKLKDKHRQHGTIPREKIDDVVRELANRVGLSEAAHLAGMSRRTFQWVYYKQGSVVRKETARLIILALYQARKEGLIYHKNDIRFGLHNPRRKSKLRKVKRPHEQRGPIFPELEAAYRAKEVERKRMAQIQKERDQQLEDLTGY